MKKTIDKIRKNFAQGYRQAKANPKYNRKRVDVITAEIAEQLGASEDQISTLKRLVRRNKESVIRQAVRDVMKRSGHNKVKQLASKLWHKRT